MVNINQGFLQLQNNYLFSEVAKRVENYQKEYPNKKIIRLGIGDVTLPIPEVITNAIKKAADEMSQKESFRGYGPEQGYAFLKEKIIVYDYQARGIDFNTDEVFVSDGAKCDVGNILDLFDRENCVAITDPVYPVYLDTNIMAGRSEKQGNIVFMKAVKENKFQPLPEELEKHVDIIYLCSPNNPTGVAMKKKVLEKWIEYAQKENSIILYDAAYEAYIEGEGVVHSIYEIDGAKKVAIEFKSFSKTAGFTGLRCAYTIVPKQLEANGVKLNELWKRRMATKFNGVSYVVQRGAEAVYTKEGQKVIRQNIEYYKENARVIKKGLEEAGYEVYGGENAPYIWLKTPDHIKSWDFLDMLLEKANVVGTPGVGFGKNGEGYFRLTAFGDREETKMAIKRIKELGV